MTGARRVVALGAWLITLAAFAAPAWCEPPVWLAIARPGAVADWQPAADAPDPVKADDPVIPPLLDPDLPIVTTSVANREPTDLRLLMAEGERWRLMELGAALTLRPLDLKVTASGQLPYVVTEPVLPDAEFDDGHEPASLGVTARVGGFEAGAQYRSVGKRLERLISAPTALKDREGHEVWVAQRLGVLRLRLSDSELTDNVDRNPALPRTTKDQTAITAELALDEWPVLGLTLASGESSRVRLTRDGQDGTLEQHEFEGITGSVYYDGGPRWNVTASSTFSRSRHVVRPDDAMAMTYHDLSLTLHPLESLSVTPTLSLGQERYAPAGFGIDTSTAALTVWYAPRASRWSASSYASYTTTRASDGSTDARSVSVTGALTYGLGRWLPGCTVSFETGYDRYVDAAVPASAAQAVSGFVLIKLAAF
jgi:hypothetical protein